MKGHSRQPKREVPHLRAVKAYLAELGATDVTVAVNGHLHISWSIRGQQVSIAIPSTPRDEDNCAQNARQLVRRRYREAGILVWGRP